LSKKFPSPALEQAGCWTGLWEAGLSFQCSELFLDWCGYLQLWSTAK